MTTFTHRVERIKASIRQSDLEGFADEAVSALKRLGNRFRILKADEDSVTVKMQAKDLDDQDLLRFVRDLGNIEGIVNIKPDGTWIISQN